MTAQSPAGSKPTHRVCSACLTNKALTPAEWPHVKGQPFGARCKLCVRAKKKHNERNRKAVRAAVRTLSKTSVQTPNPVATQADGKVGTAVAPLRGGLTAGQLQIERALNRGASVINEYAQDVLELVVHYALTQDSVHHEWALKMLAERVIPTKLYTAIGAHAAGVDKDDRKQTPTVVINVGGTPLPGGSGTVRVLPAPIDVAGETLSDLEDLL